MNEYLSNFVIASTMIIGITMLFFYLIGQDKVKEFLIASSEKTSASWDKVRQLYEKFCFMVTPKSDSKIADWYRKFLMYSRFETKEFFELKIGLFLIVFVFYIAVAITDNRMAINEIYDKFMYINDPMFNEAAYTPAQKEVILEKKNEMFEYVSDEIGFDVLLTFDDESAIAVIENMIFSINDTGIPDETIAKEMLAKIKAYEEQKTPDFSASFKFGLLVFFLPEVCIWVVNFLNKSNERAEKRFMKRLIIMNGSIKPTDFMMVLAELIDKSKYFKKILQEIEDSNKRNYEENTKIYQKYIAESKDLETKLFFEKLDEANNYDFDQAIINIKNEFNLDKRMQTRKVKKTVENIHVWGLVGFMALIVFIIMYLLMPWMSTYELGALM